MTSVIFPGNPGSVVSDGLGGLLIGDAGVRVRRAVRTAAGGYRLTTIAGNGTVGWFGDGGNATAAGLNQPFAVTPDGSGGVYVADTSNCASEAGDRTGRCISSKTRLPPLQFDASLCKAPSRPSPA